MRIPDKLKIRKSTWKVKINERQCRAEDALGLCIRESKKIVLSPDQPRNELEETFLHEILHAAWPADVCSSRLEERIIAKLSPVLFKALSDNKLFGDD